MSEPRKNHLSIDGGQVKEDEHVASYKPIPESDTEFRSSKNSLAKSKEKISPDGAEEKLLPKETEAKIVSTRVDMADAKYVVGDHRNGDAKIELDANKRQFTGLSKEELMKYAEDPFWVRLRWTMFILFWALWLCMLAGAITIIIRAPKCAPPTPRTWFEKGPLVDMSAATYDEITAELPQLQKSKVQGVFVDVPTYDNEPPTVMENFKTFVQKAKEYDVKVIVDLILNYVSIDHEFFQLSKSKTFDYEDYFVWAAGKGFDEDGKPKPPNNWVSTMNTSAWTFNDARGEFYLHQFGDTQADLNFNNPKVLAEADKTIRRWIKAGAVGVRLNKARLLVVNASLPDEVPAFGRGSEPGTDHTYYGYWRHQHTSDQPELDSLLTRWAEVVKSASENPEEAVFTVEEDGGRAELFLLSHNVTSLRPLMTSPLAVTRDVTTLASEINTRIGKQRWPAMMLKSSPDMNVEVASLALLLPAAPVLDAATALAATSAGNDTSDTESLSHLVSLRSDPSVEHGHHAVTGVPARNSTQNLLLACARWKAGHTGYLAVLNPTDEELRANLTLVTSVPDTLTVHHMSHQLRMQSNYTNNHSESSDNVLVPAKSTLVLSYVPKTAVEN